jgi:hypothetical protein
VRTTRAEQSRVQPLWHCWCRVHVTLSFTSATSSAGEEIGDLYPLMSTARGARPPGLRRRPTDSGGLLPRGDDGQLLKPGTCEELAQIPLAGGRPTPLPPRPRAQLSGSNFELFLLRLGGDRVVPQHSRGESHPSYRDAVCDALLRQDERRPRGGRHAE